MGRLRGSTGHLWIRFIAYLALARLREDIHDVPEPIDIVNVFRTPEFLDKVVEAVIAVGAKTLWAQLGVVSLDEQPERKALKAGLKVV
jgi:uncharacterized protein